jgi:hypothetical protein
MQVSNGAVQQLPIEPKILAVLGVDDYMTRTYYTPQRRSRPLHRLLRQPAPGDTMHSPELSAGSGLEPVSNNMPPVSILLPALGNGATS